MKQTKMRRSRAEAHKAATGGRADQASGQPPKRRIPWTFCRTLVLGSQGEYEITLPKECPLQALFLELTRQYNPEPSYHDALEVVFVVEGDGRFTLAGEVGPVGPGDWVLIGPRELHRLEVMNVGVMKAMCLYLLPDLLVPPGGSPLDCELLRPFYYRGPKFSHRIPAAACFAFSNHGLDAPHLLRNSIEKPAPRIGRANVHADHTS